VLILTSILWWYFRLHESLEEYGIIAQFFSGIKNTAPCRFFSTIWLFRRISFVTTIMVFDRSNYLIVIGILFGTEISYILFLCIQRPFILARDNICEISNELFILASIVFIVFYNDEGNWSELVNVIFLGMLMLSNVIFTST
jgi:hypothetical protein